MVGYSILCSLLLLLPQSFGFGYQETEIYGKLTCGGKDLRGQNWVKIFLREDDGDGRSDLLDEGYATVNGTYHLKGGQFEWNGIEPYTVIAHSCGGKCRILTLHGPNHNPGNMDLLNKGDEAPANNACHEQKYSQDITEMVTPPWVPCNN
ncbi:unnamed protein product [Bursaphelenchus xylophilus]|uniref:(pine wood nematode) hypothetical protein n=1 Tax=Bursaphelenchus xylophilus TaxID=6326 RepID=A0A1I7S667_BURXY|nr:unnamed protein product [Bursaphelenchus xylophilus]CAG9081047.1 unnamed protein product [Bursaphelenchus xylophilus]